MTKKFVHMFPKKSLSLFAAASLVLVGCGADEEEGPSIEGALDGDRPDLTGHEIVLGTSLADPLYASLFHSADLLEEWGADVELEMLTEVTGLEALVADQIDVSGRSTDETATGVDRGESMTGIGAPQTAMPYTLVSESGIDSVADLEGQNLAISSPGGFDALLFRYLLQEEGLDPSSDVSQSQIGGSPERTQALLSGEIDAAIIFINGLVQIEQETDELNNVGYIDDLLPDPFHMSIYASYDDYWEENHEVAVAFACANLDTNKWINDEREEYIDFVLDIDEGATEEAAEEFYDIAMDIELWPTEMDEILDPQNVDSLVEGMVESEELAQPMPSEEIIDTAYLEEAAEMGCGE